MEIPVKKLFAAIFLTSLSHVVFAQAPPDLILVNGKIFTGDPAKPSAESLGIRGDRIVAIGTTAEIAKLVGKTTRRIDLQGRVAVPGFNEAHYHFFWPRLPGRHLQFKSMEPSWEETTAAIRTAAAQEPAGNWISGFVGATVILNDQVTRFALDKIAPNHPVALIAYNGHGFIINSKAMRPLQIKEDEADPSGGYFERVANSRSINGRLWEYAQFDRERLLTARASDDEAIKALRQMGDEAAGYGVTTLQIMPQMPIDRFVRLLIKADLPVRVRAIPCPMTTAKGRDVSEIRSLVRMNIGNPKVTVSGIKWILDGTPLERGAANRADYNDKPGERGKLNFPEKEIAAMLQESLDLKQQILLHCSGDRAAEAVIAAMESYGTKVDWKSKRVRIEHGDGVTGDLIARASKLGIIVVQNPTHFAEVEVIPARCGPNTSFFPLRSYLEANLAFALGSDGSQGDVADQQAPAEERLMNPFLNIMLATIHPARPKEAITREQAVRAYTYGSAYAEFTEKDKGTLAPGKLADLAILSQDIFTTPVPELPKTISILTVTGGKIVHDTKALAGASAGGAAAQRAIER